MDKTLTIAVAAYNIEKTLDRLMQSVLPAELEDLEVLIVNDGSRDKTREIAEHYASIYPDIVHVLNKENGGHGSVINAAIDAAEGKYFKELDGDDWLETKSLMTVVHALRTLDCDLILNPYETYDVRTGKKEFQSVDYDAGRLETNKVYPFEETVEHIQYSLMHAFIYKTEMLRSSGVRMDEHVFYDDNEYVLLPIPYVKTVEIREEPLYVYQIGDSGASMASSNRWKRRFHLRKVVETLVHSYQSLNCSEAVRKYLLTGTAGAAGTLYNIYFTNPDAGMKDYPELLEYDAWLKKQSEEVYQSARGQKIDFFRKFGKNGFRLIRAGRAVGIH